MSDGSKIEWTDATWNPLRARNIVTGKTGHFCVHKSEGCKFCYAERMQPRFGNPVRYAAQDAGKVDLFLDEQVLMKPLRWRKPRMVFVCSMTDLFYDQHTGIWLHYIFDVMEDCPQHTFQVLTKRPARMREFMTNRYEEYGRPIPENVWLGTSIELPHLWSRAVELTLTPAACRFLSLEPLLGGLGTHVHIVDKMDWVIVGGESGPNARPMHPDWAREVRDHCLKEGVPFFLKQNGEWAHAKDWGHWLCARQGIALARDGTQVSVDEDTTWHNDDGVAMLIRVGKSSAGRLLDGVTHDAFPVTGEHAR